MENLSKVYKKVDSTDNNEQLKEVKKLDDSANPVEQISKKIVTIEKKLSDLASAEGIGGKVDEFFIRNVNDYLQSKYGCKFEKTAQGGLILVFEKENELKEKLSKLNENLVVKEKEIFLDKDGDKQMDTDEVGIRKVNGKVEGGGLYVNKNEVNKMYKIKGNQGKEILDKKEYTKGGRLILEKGVTYYVVGQHGDKLAAVGRLFTVLSNEFFGGMKIKELNKKISQLWYNQKTGEFSAKPPENGQEGWEKVGDFSSDIWKKIVKPGAKINLTSLANALGTVDVPTVKVSAPKEEKKQEEVSKTVKKEEENGDVGGKMEQVQEKKETSENLEGWGRFYMSGGVEIWDIPDDKTINYNGYTSSYKGLNGKQISISASSLYDFADKGKGKEGNNTFSSKKVVQIGEKNCFLVVGENLNNEEISIDNDFSSIDDIKKSFQNKKVEAWLVKPNGTNWNIYEVGDKKVHTVTETSETVEKGKDPDHPIVLEKQDNNYICKTNVEGKDITLKFKFEKNGENENLVLSEDIKKDDILKAFGGETGYVAIENKVYKVSLTDKNEVDIKPVESKFSPEVNFGGLNIFSVNISGVEYDKNTKKITFPEVKGWGKIEGYLKKEKVEGKEKIAFTLDKEFTREILGDNEVKLLFEKEQITNESKKISIDKLYKNTIANLLLYSLRKDTNILLAKNSRKIEKKDGQIILDAKNINTDLLSLLDKAYAEFRDTKETKKDDFILAYVLKGIKEKITVGSKNKNVKHKQT